jgi:hypothetical protein
VCAYAETNSRLPHSTRGRVVLKKTVFLGLGGPGLKIRVLKEHSCPAPVLEGGGLIYNIFGVRVRAFKNLGGMLPKHPKDDHQFLGAFNWARGPRGGLNSAKMGVGK